MKDANGMEGNKSRKESGGKIPDRKPRQTQLLGAIKRGFLKKKGDGKGEWS